MYEQNQSGQCLHTSNVDDIDTSSGCITVSTFKEGENYRCDSLDFKVKGLLLRL